MKRRIGSTLMVFLWMVFGGVTALRASEIYVKGGRLILCNQLYCGRLTVSEGAFLEGRGYIQGEGTIHGHIRPGFSSNDTASLRFTALSLGASSVYECSVESDGSTDCLYPGYLAEADGQLAVQVFGAAQPYQQAVVANAGHTQFDTLQSLLPEGWGLFTNAATESLCLTDTALDTDADGLPDWWEESWFSGRNTAEGDADADQDGMDNGAEYVAGTSPVDAASRLFLLGGVDDQTAAFVGRWPSVENRTYTVWVTDDLGGKPFEIYAEDIAATPPFNVFTNDSVAGQAVYYRIGVRIN